MIRQNAVIVGILSLLAMLFANLDPARACGVHDHGCRYHGAAAHNSTGVQASPDGSLNFTTTWTPNASSQTPDLDAHVLLQDGAGPYTVTGGSSPIGVNTPFRPWAHGTPQFERNVYYVQPTITYNGGAAQATFSGDVHAGSPSGNCALTGSGICEEVRILGDIPDGDTHQQTYRPTNVPGDPPNPSGVGSTYVTQIWSTPGYVIDKVTVGGTEVFADHRGIYNSGAGNTILTDTTSSPEVVVTGRQVSVHAEGVKLNVDVQDKMPIEAKKTEEAVLVTTMHQLTDHNNDDKIIIPSTQSNFRNMSNLIEENTIISSYRAPNRGIDASIFDAYFSLKNEIPTNIYVDASGLDVVNIFGRNIVLGLNNYLISGQIIIEDDGTIASGPYDLEYHYFDDDEPLRSKIITAGRNVFTGVSRVVHGDFDIFSSRGSLDAVVNIHYIGKPEIVDPVEFGLSVACRFNRLCRAIDFNND